MSDLTHRERVLKALNHEEPDRVPISLNSFGADNILYAAYENLKEYLGLAQEKEVRLRHPYSEGVIVDEEIRERFGIDTQALTREGEDWLEMAQQDLGGEQDQWEDMWGVVWGRPAGGFYIEVKSPFAECPSIEAIERHKWPDPGDHARVQGLKETAIRLRETTDRALVLRLPARVLSFGQQLCGFQDFMEYLLLEQAFVEALLEKAVEIQTGLCKQMLDEVGEYADVVTVSDDLGTQYGPQISPRMYRKMIKPYQKRLFAFIKENTQASLLLHSDGGFYPLIGDLIEIGVDALNPVQVSAAGMDPKRLKAEFGADLAFWGGVDTQQILPFGSPREVEEEAKRLIDDLAPGGGYVLAAVHTIQREVPPENVVAMFDTALGYGRYK